MRLLTAAREGVAAFRRVWAAAAIEDQRARAGSTDAEQVAQQRMQKPQPPAGRLIREDVDPGPVPTRPWAEQVELRRRGMG